MIAPKAPGTASTELFRKAWALPGLLAVSRMRRAGQTAGPRVCAGAGGLKAGVIETTFQEETEATSSAAERAVRRDGGWSGGLRDAGGSGYQPESLTGPPHG
jgi:ketol-acid reductoisomerase